MSDKRPIITFHASATAAATPEAVYAVLSNLQAHLAWAGEQAPNKNFRLLTLDAPEGSLTTGARFASTGANGKMTFHDESTVAVAEPGRAFGFDTKSKLVRPHRPALDSGFTHRYELEKTEAGTRISYRCAVWPKNYRPYWLHPLMRPMTRLMIDRAMARNLANLVTAAESVKRASSTR